MARLVCALWARQTGKDFTTEGIAVRDCIMKPKTTWMVAAPSERQSVESILKAKDWALAFGAATEGVVYDRAYSHSLLKSASIDFHNGSRIFAVPGRPDTVRGMSANLIFSEFAFFDDADATWQAIMPSITNPMRGGKKRVIIISTPNGKSGSGARFFKIVDENLENKKPGRKLTWSVHKVTIEDAVREGLPIDIAEIRAALDDDDAFAQEYLCEFRDVSNVLLPYDLISQAESADASEIGDPALFTDGCRKELYCGIDFGRVVDPTVCWTWERVGDLLITREVLVLRGMDSPDQQAILRSRIAASRRTCFDYTGPGIGLGDYMARDFGEYDPGAHQFGKLEKCTFTPLFKRSIFPKLRKVFEAPTKVRIPISVEIREDLHAMNQIVKNGEYSYNAPRTSDGHSDRCTAAALGIRAAGDVAVANFVPTPVFRKAAYARSFGSRERYNAA